MSLSIGFTKSNMTVIDEYFYMFDESEDMLVQKTVDGTIAFTYPFDVLLSEEIKSAEWDGVNWWTLEDSATADSVVIRRWRVSNYICQLQQTFSLIAGSGHKYDSDTFTVEHYHATITGTHSIGATTIYIDTGYDTLLPYATSVTLENSSGSQETIDVLSSGAGYVTLNDPTTQAYTNSNTVHFYTYLWLFNNYDGEDASTGALYKLNAYSGSYVNRYDGGVYKDVEASTFCDLDSFGAYGDIHVLYFIKYVNLLMVDVSSTGSDLDYYGSMILDSSISAPSDLAIVDDNIYVLNGSTAELITTSTFVASIALSANPAIIATNPTGVHTSTTTVTAVVKDQFGNPVSGRAVTFSEDGEGSLVGSNPSMTDSDGRATITYEAGESAEEVAISATVEQL